MNIEDVQIDMTFLDTTVSKKSSMAKRTVVVKNKTVNSVEVFMKAKSEEGIDCTQWFLIEDFNKRFTNGKI